MIVEGIVLVYSSISIPNFNLKNIFMRKIEFIDVPDVMYINRLTLPENYSRYTFIGLYRHFRDISFVAIDKSKDKPIAYILNKLDEGYSFFSKEKRIVKKGHVFSVAVLPEYRNRGIASALLALGFNAMFLKNVEEIYLEVRVSNKPAINLYKKFGMKVVGVIKSYYVDGEDANVMAVSKKDSIDLVNSIIKEIKNFVLEGEIENGKEENCCYRS